MKRHLLTGSALVLLAASPPPCLHRDGVTRGSTVLADVVATVVLARDSLNVEGCAPACWTSSFKLVSGRLVPGSPVPPSA